MKKLFIILTLTLLLSARGSPITDAPTTKTGNGYAIRRIDGCQYIEVVEGLGNNRTYSITHKGNCDNPLHCENQN